MRNHKHQSKQHSTVQHSHRGIHATIATPAPYTDKSIYSIISNIIWEGFIVTFWEGSSPSSLRFLPHMPMRLELDFIFAASSFSTSVTYRIVGSPTIVTSPVSPRRLSIFSLPNTRFLTDRYTVRRSQLAIDRPNCRATFSAAAKCLMSAPLLTINILQLYRKNLYDSLQVDLRMELRPCKRDVY